MIQTKLPSAALRGSSGRRSPCRRAVLSDVGADGRTVRPRVGCRRPGARVWATSLTLAAVVTTSSEVPRPPQIRWCLLPDLRRPTGNGPVSAPPIFHADVGAVHARPRPVEFAGRIQFGEQDLVQLLKDAGLLPPLQTAPAGLSRAEPQLQRQELPGHVGAEHVQDALQTQSAGPPAVAPARLGPGRQQRFDQHPQVIVHEPGSRTLPNGRILTSVTVGQATSTRSSHEPFDLKPRKFIEWPLSTPIPGPLQDAPIAKNLHQPWPAGTGMPEPLNDVTASPADRGVDAGGDEHFRQQR